MTRRSLGSVVVGVVLAAAAAGCAAPATTATSWTTPAASAALEVSALPAERIAQPEPARLDGEQPPPTNRWYSGMVFGDDTQPVYPFPLAVSMGAEGFTIDLPEVTATSATIAASFGGGLAVDLGASAFEVVRFDPVSVTARYSDEDGPIAEVTLAEGWPAVGIVAERELTLSIAAPLQPAGAGVWTAEADGTTFGIVAPDAHDDGLRLPAGAAAQVFALPEDGSVDAWAEALDEPVTAVTTEYALAAASVSTRLSYADDGTVIVPFPAHESAEDCDLGTFETAYGPAPACAAEQLEWSVPRIAATDSYDLEGIDDERRTALVAQLTADLDTAPPAPADTYFGGKSLARTASLVMIARVLGEDALAERAAERLEADLLPWTQADGCERRGARCFVYDDALAAVVGREPSFGSEEANDHHFHYGYFLTAGAALVAERPDLEDELATVLDLLAADIATGTPDGALPALRVFDPYRGHSWASGFSPFADGNNQESSSEAVAAWNGLALWARARGDRDLEERAEWMLSAEAAAARALWLEPSPATLPAGYEHGIVSLTWGGKRDYATWFSAEPSAILGIQVLPVAPVGLEYLADAPERVAANVAEAGGVDAFAGPLGDYVLAYSALAGGDALDAAEAAVARLEPADLDGGNSLSAMLAWLAAARLHEAG